MKAVQSPMSNGKDMFEVGNSTWNVERGMVDSESWKLNAKPTELRYVRKPI